MNLLTVRPHVLRAWLITTCLVPLVGIGCGGTSPSELSDPGDGGSGTGGDPNVEIPVAGGAGGSSSRNPNGICGNGELESGEVCDDGNTEAGDGCPADCSTPDPDYFCATPGEPCVKVVICGNGTLEGDEVCDDGNTEAGDGCAEECDSVEEGWACGRPGTDCVEVPVCGNGERERGEQCDDGEETPSDGDGCSAECQFEEGFWCPTPGEACVALECGDGTRTPGEECDDGNKLLGDGCSDACVVENGWRCSTAGCATVCGDELQSGSESCDDGNRVSGDGCSAACTEEPFWSCTQALGQGAASTCVSSIECGNNVVEPGEICDPPGVDGCELDCKGFSPDITVVSECGNSVIEAGETCDPPQAGNGCNSSCETEAGWTCPRPGDCFRVPACGDGLVQPNNGEECDVGSMSSPGCIDCQVQTNWYCSGFEPSTCVEELCGDGKRTPSEACDDGNGVDGDGCSGCTVDAGWVCPFENAACFPRCGDGTLLGGEECDDGNTVNDDGCNSVCRLEPGYDCPTPDEACVSAECGNGGDPEPGEGCDDGNTIAGDGCGPTCQVEPVFVDGVPTNLSCGDGLVVGAEACDDGNTESGDGCSDACELEPYFDCQPLVEYPDSVELQVTYRDFKARGTDPGGHPDFEWEPNPERPGIPGPVCTTSNADPCMSDPGESCPAGTCGYLDDLPGESQGKPVFHLTGNPHERGTITDEFTYSLWYRDANPTPYASDPIEGRNGEIDMWSVTDTLLLNQVGGSLSDVYEYDSSSHFPLDGRLFGNEGRSHNFHFTTELRYFFQYQGGETLTFRGDDDVWVFVNGRHAVDIGGVHAARWGRVVLGDDGDGAADDSDCSIHLGDLGNSVPEDCPLEPEEEASDDDARFGLTQGGVYEIVLFHAERHTTASNFRLTLAGFLAPRSYCKPICGDGEVVGGEVCDDGLANQDGVSGACSTDCSRFAYCGDTLTQSGEECDNGVNTDLYGSGAGLCAPGCVTPPYCGDTQVQPAYELCDRGGLNDDQSYGFDSCTTTCGLGGYCGDGTLNGPELCDLGAGNSAEYGAECGLNCEPGAFCGDGVRNGSEECDGTANCTDECIQGPFCGDGTPNNDEECDYGQFASTAYGGCTNTCEWGPQCGDATRDAPYEECDLGATLNVGGYDGCTNACVLGPHCGDAVLQASEGEACDNGFNDDTYELPGVPTCAPGCERPAHCGDGVVQPAYELCDAGEDNDDNAYEGCTSTCDWGPYCGDGEVQADEACDAGPNNTSYAADGEGCGYDCQPAPYCGDGERSGPEQCDLGADANTGDYGSCKADCTLAPRCGDFVVQKDAGEQCDDGTTGSEDCTADCRGRGGLR